MVKLAYSKDAILESFKDLLISEIEMRTPFSISFYSKGLVVVKVSPKYEEPFNVLDSIEKLIKLGDFSFCEICFE